MPPNGNDRPDYALYLLNETGSVVAWYAGATLMYGYQSDEVIGRHISFLHFGEAADARIKTELDRAACDGHLGTEGWQTRKDGSTFWANSITKTLRDETGALKGFAGLSRDFTNSHEQDEKLQRQ